ncbi:hypothetical protein AAEX28_02000 [Lentisphaerota bacterium WC36G]|nr:hypothetical protein LJT99_04885 [Lentisphaerae bacterium WC36]
MSKLTTEEKKIAYEFIGKLAVCLYASDIKISYSSLKHILSNRIDKYNDSYRGGDEIASSAAEFFRKKKEHTKESIIRESFVSKESISQLI